MEDLFCNYLLRDLYNQKGRVHIGNICLDILLHVTSLTFFILILFHFPLPKDLLWFLVCFASLTFSIFFLSHALALVSLKKPVPGPLFFFISPIN